MFPFGAASPLPAQPRGLVLLPKGPHHKPVQAVGRLVVNHVRELIGGGKEEKGERGVFFSFPRLFFLPSAGYKARDQRGLPEALQQTCSNATWYFPCCQGKYKQGGKKNPQR